VTTAPMSVRPAASFDTSAERSKSSAWILMSGETPPVIGQLPACHRGKQRDLPCPRDRLLVIGMFLIDRHADRFRMQQRLRIALVARAQPRQQVAYRHDVLRQVDIFFRLAYAFANP